MSTPLCMECDAPAVAVDPREDAADRRGPYTYCTRHVPPAAVPLGEWDGPLTGGRPAPRRAPADDGQPTMG